MDTFTTSDEICAWLKIDRRTLFRLRQSGFPQPVKIGGSLRWRTGDVVDWYSKL